MATATTTSANTRRVPAVGRAKAPALVGEILRGVGPAEMSLVGAPPPPPPSLVGASAALAAVVGAAVAAPSVAVG
eukprot:384054-Prorocentrum_minimum.AAC.1